MANISNLGYFVIGASNLDAWERFAVNIIGLQAGRKVAGKSLALRADDYAQRILLENNPADDILAVGWELDTEDELLEFVKTLQSRQIPVTEGSRGLASSRCVERLFSADDPNGFKHEFYVGAQRAPMADAFRSQVLKSGFVTGRLGLGHLVTVAKDLKQTIDFYKTGLGLKVSDYIRAEAAPGMVIDATFFHAATGRHHSIATAPMPGFPKKANHIMLEVKEMDDVGLAYDRCIAAGLPIIMGLGHHPNDGMFSFYVVNPSGFGVEVGWGGLVVDDDQWEIKRYAQLSDWGHKPGARPPGH